MANLTLTATQVRCLDGSIIDPNIVAGEAMTVGDLVQINLGSAVKANNTTAGGVAGLLGLVVSGSRYVSTGAVASGEAISVLLFGRAELGVSQSLTGKGVLFTSTTAGKIADATSTNARAIANVITATTIFFNPSVA